MTSRNWILTLNNPEAETAEYLEGIHNKLKAVYTCGQLEVGDEGTPHIQFYMNFKAPCRPAMFKRHDKRIHFEKVSKTEHKAAAYCLKDKGRLDGPYEYGLKPVRVNNKTDWEEVKANAISGDLSKIPANIFVSHYGNLTKIAKDHMKRTESETVKGIWIWGPSGIGKSHKARADFPDYYPKLCNKWWDGYQGESAVIMDDVGLGESIFGQKLKIWADKWGACLEIKGGSLPNKFQHFIVTSQYPLEKIWPDDSETLTAIRRRFKVIHMPGTPITNCKERLMNRTVGDLPNFGKLPNGKYIGQL